MSHDNLINKNNVVTENNVRFFNVEAIAKHLNTDLDMIDVMNKADFIIKVDVNNRYSSIFVEAQLFTSYALTLRILKKDTNRNASNIKAVLANLIELELNNKHANANQTRYNGTIKARQQAHDIMKSIKTVAPTRGSLTVKKTVLEKIVDTRGVL